ncbi:MAG: 3-dehydro-L-gulonate 2-dehydrogenase [Vicinamibacterales bacterium]
MRISYQELVDTFRSVLGRVGFSPDRADLCARLFADASRDGVASHGLNRFPRFMDMIRLGVIDVSMTPVRVAGAGALERWDGRRGPGNLNAHACMDAAIALSRQHGIGCVALSNTNHWMRGGNYGWQAADAGAIGICWTNTLANMPPWGASQPRVGNNPLVIAVPRPAGAVVLDMAMSQFSFGALESYRRRNELLPVVGGYNEAGELTRDAAAIEASRRPLPIGFWKGSGLALMLDMVATVLADGRATHEISHDPLHETDLSQVFIAMSAERLGGGDASAAVARIIDDLHAPSQDDGAPRFPGERTLETRQRNMSDGIPVDPGIWEAVKRM